MPYPKKENYIIIFLLFSRIIQFCLLDSNALHLYQTNSTNILDIMEYGLDLIEYGRILDLGIFRKQEYLGYDLRCLWIFVEEGKEYSSAAL